MDVHCYMKGNSSVSKDFLIVVRDCNVHYPLPKLYFSIPAFDKKRLDSLIYDMLFPASFLRSIGFG